MVAAPWGLCRSTSVGESDGDDSELEGLGRNSMSMAVGLSSCIGTNCSPGGPLPAGTLPPAADGSF